MKKSFFKRGASALLAVVMCLSTVIKVNKANMAQKGTVTVEKNGEVFFGVDVSGDETTVIYQPIYKDAALEGAVFEIRAQRLVLGNE